MKVFEAREKISGAGINGPASVRFVVDDNRDKEKTMVKVFVVQGGEPTRELKFCGARSCSSVLVKLLGDTGVIVSQESVDAALFRVFQ